STRICGHLTQEPVARPTAYHVDSPEVHTSDALELVNRPAVLECKALKDAARDLARLGAQRLPALSRELDDPGRHVARAQQALIIRIDQCRKRRCRLR